MEKIPCFRVIQGIFIFKIKIFLKKNVLKFFYVNYKFYICFIIQTH